MTAHPTVISRRPTQAPSGLLGMPSAPWVSPAAACLKGLPLHRQDHCLSNSDSGLARVVSIQTVSPALQHAYCA